MRLDIFQIIARYNYAERIERAEFH
jgi:hypothetical protein